MWKIMTILRNDVTTHVRVGHGVPSLVYGGAFPDPDVEMDLGVDDEHILEMEDQKNMTS